MSKTVSFHDDFFLKMKMKYKQVHRFSSNVLTSPVLVHLFDFTRLTSPVLTSPVLTFTCT